LFIPWLIRGHFTPVLLIVQRRLFGRLGGPHVRIFLSKISLFHERLKPDAEREIRNWVDPSYRGLAIMMKNLWELEGVTTVVADINVTNAQSRAAARKTYPPPAEIALMGKAEPV
jgi:hypothetical protein